MWVSIMVLNAYSLHVSITKYTNLLVTEYCNWIVCQIFPTRYYKWFSYFFLVCFFAFISMFPSTSNIKMSFETKISNFTNLLNTWFHISKHLPQNRPKRRYESQHDEFFETSKQSMFYVTWHAQKFYSNFEIILTYDRKKLTTRVSKTL